MNIRTGTLFVCLFPVFFLLGSLPACAPAQTGNGESACSYLQREYDRLNTRAACLSGQPGVFSFGTLGKYCLNNHLKENRWLLPSGNQTDGWQAFLPMPPVEDDTLLHPDGEYVRAEQWGTMWVVVWDPPPGEYRKSFIRFATNWAPDKDPRSIETYVVILEERLY